MLFQKLKCALMSLIMLRYTLSGTVQTVSKWRTKSRNNVLKLLLSVTCWKRVITSTQ